MGGGRDSVFPGTTFNPSASGNTVTINYSSNNNPWRVVGGYSATANVSGNRVYMLQGNVQDNIYGGLSNVSNGGDVFNNHVTMNDGTVGGYVVGGSLLAPSNFSAYHNTVTMNGGTAASLVGGEAVQSSAHHNTVTLNAGTVTGINVNMAIAGGWSNNGNAYNNTINLNGGRVSGGIFGAYHGNRPLNNVYNNTINIRNQPDLHNASLYGHNGATGTVYNNSLNIYTSGVRVQNTANFTDYNFYLPVSVKAGDTLLNVSGTANVSGANVAAKGMAVGQVFTAGDSLTIINATTLSGNAKLVNNGTLSQGVGLNYGYNLKQIGNRIVFTITEDAILNPQSKALSEGRLAALTTTTGGGDLIQSSGLGNALTAAQGGMGLSPFVAAQYQDSRYNTGSHINVEGVSYLAGLAARHANLTLGIFVEGGDSDYTSDNNFSNAASVKGNGDTDYYGWGLLGQYDINNNLYIDGSLRMGRTKVSFASADLVDNMTGISADYKSQSDYYGAHIGIGYKWQWLDNTQLDFSSRYLWTTVDSDQVTLSTGEEVNFDSMNSHRWRNGVELRHQQTESLKFITGLAYEYEFDGEAKAKLYNRFDIDAPKVKGGTGIAQLGFDFKPQSLPDLTVGARVNGYTGKREGIAGSVFARYMF